MFANLLNLFPRRPADDYELAFVEDVRVRRPAESRNPRVERLILICWVLIAIKHAAILYACHRWPVPFHPLWVNAPTWLLGVLATLVYYQND